jgi:hypothetical protein
MKDWTNRTGMVAAALLCALVAACDTPPPDGVLIELAPDVISSAEGTMHVRALVVDDRSPRKGESVSLEVSYTDRNGEAHTIDGVSGDTDKRGVFEATLSGFDFEGVGTVTASVLDAGGAPIVDGDGEPISSDASFSVVDLSPPSVAILPPTSDLVVGAGFPLQVQVEVEDEIGISEVFIEAAGELDRQRSTVVASGETSATVTFDFDIPRDAIAGPTITLYAMAADLSGNLSAAEPVVLTVDPFVDIGVPAGFDGALLSDGSNNFLDDPRALAVSPMDGKIYVADNSQNSPCQDACIRVVDPASGSVEGGVVINGQGTIEGIAFDATGDTLYYSDRQDRVVSLSWNDTAQTYDSPQNCVDPQAQNPQDPIHLIFDATLGIMVVDRQDNRVKTKAACDLNDAQDLTQGNLDQPHGIAAGGAGEFYLSDRGNDVIFQFDDQGDLTLFENDVRDPRGIVWIDGGDSVFADSLAVAERDRQTVSSTQGNGTSPVAFLRNDPVDVDIAGDTLYILTQPSAGDRGRIFSVTGF